MVSWKAMDVGHEGKFFCNFSVFFSLPFTYAHWHANTHKHMQLWILLSDRRAIGINERAVATANISSLTGYTRTALRVKQSLMSNEIT